MGAADDTLLLDRPTGAHRGRPAVPPPQGTRFEAPTPQGLLQLLARGDLDSATCAAQAAVLLEGCAELLAALDGWLGHDLAWRWPAASPVVSPGAHGPHWPAAACQLSAPWALWRSLPAPPPLLAQGLLWPELDALLSLGWLGLSDEDLAALEPGGAVLMPPAAPPATAHPCRLRASDELPGPQVGLALGWRPGARPQWCMADEAAAGALPPPSPGMLCELRLAQVLRVPGRLLAGWAAPPLPQGESAAGLYRGPACLGEGTLVPWGDGWALLLHQVHADTVADIHSQKD